MSLLRNSPLLFFESNQLQNLTQNLKIKFIFIMYDLKFCTFKCVKMFYRELQTEIIQYLTMSEISMLFNVIRNESYCSSNQCFVYDRFLCKLYDILKKCLYIAYNDNRIPIRLNIQVQIWEITNESVHTVLCVTSSTVIG